MSCRNGGADNGEYLCPEGYHSNHTQWAQQQDGFWCREGHACRVEDCCYSIRFVVVRIYIHLRAQEMSSFCSFICSFVLLRVARDCTDDCSRLLFDQKLGAKTRVMGSTPPHFSAHRDTITTPKLRRSVPMGIARLTFVAPVLAQDTVRLFPLVFYSNDFHLRSRSLQRHKRPRQPIPLPRRGWLH